MSDPLTGPDEDPPPVPGARRSLRTRAEALTARGQAAMSRIEQERPSHASIEVAFRALIRDKQVAGSVLGGGLAYRLFFWTLALTVLICGGLGFAANTGDNVDSAMKEAGMTTAVAATISSAAQESESGRWWLLLVGAFSLVWFSWSLLRALRLVHAAAWGVPLPPLRNAPRALCAVLAVPVVLALLAAATGFIRDHADPAPGLAATLAVGVLFAAVWLVASTWLPSADVSWTAFIPGAVVFGIGLEALHLFTVYFLANQLADASELYGALGLAATMLFYLFLVGRGVIWGAELNAVVWTVRVEHGAVDSGRSRQTLPNGG
jgi:uncharacterized BrkB/YihY/UPF0761 family membrane protein